MKILQRIALISFALMIFAGFGAPDASAQSRAGVRAGGRVVRVAPRVAAIRRYPSYYSRYWRYGYYPFGYDPFWNDPYYTNPRLRALADRVYYEKEVNESKRKISKYNEKFRADGVITEKERKKLDKAYREYQKDLRRLRENS